MLGSTELKVRTLRLDVTPKVGVPLGGRMGVRFASKIHSSLEINIALLKYQKDACCIIAIDALYAGEQLTVEIERAVQELFCLPKAQVIISASHTHSAPNIDDSKPKLGVVDEIFQKDLIAKVLDGLKQMTRMTDRSVCIYAGRQECRVGTSRRRFWPLPRITKSGISFPGVVMAPSFQAIPDPNVRCLVIKDRISNKVICLIWTFACHPTGLPLQNAISSDYIGEVRQAIRDYFSPDCVVLFLQGFSGDIRPPSGQRKFLKVMRELVSGPRFIPMTLPLWGEWTKKICRSVLQATHGAQLKQVGQSCVPNKSLVEIPLKNILNGSENLKRNIWKRLSLYEGQEMLTTNAEPVSDWQRLLRQHSGVNDQWLIGCEGDVFGYLPLENTIRQGGYEANGHLESFSLSGKFHSCPEEIVLNAMSGLMDNK